MNRGLYRKLAFQNILKNRNTFLPFSLSCISMVAMFYMLYSIRIQVDENTFFGARSMRMILGFGIVVCGIFAVFVLIYTNSFLMKRRSREFGLYSILGMEKKHIAKVVFWEIAMVGAGCIVTGLLAGMLFSRLMFLVLLKMLRLETDFTFGISGNALLFTFILFTGVFILMMAANGIRVALLKPVDLMQSERKGEREPKAKWLMALIGLVCLSIGYYLAVTVENPIKAMQTFFIAVLFVIAGTYLVFISGSIALLKILKKNKNFYYQKNHFITVSGMMYRMKQNAAGLSTICILSTAVLVVISGTISLYMGMDDVISNRYPRDVMTSYLYEKGMDEEEWEGKFPYHYDYSVIQPALLRRASRYHVQIKDVQQYYCYSDYGKWKDNQYITGDLVFDDDGVELKVFPLEDYEAVSGEKISLGKGEVLACVSDGIELSGNTIDIVGLKVQIKKEMEKIPFSMPFEEISAQICLIVPDIETMEQIRDSVNEVYSEYYTEYEYRTNISYYYNFNLEGKAADKEAFGTGLRDEINNTNIAHLADVNCMEIDKKDFFAIYGSLFFVGIFIGVMFLITTVMIIYYKQISEGFDDRERFEILQKVGMSQKEVKSVIRSQIILVFFLPILLAVIHICFAFKIILELLALLELTNVPLFIGCTVGTVAVFAIVYGIVYGLTAKAYYRITYSGGRAS